MNEYLLKLYEWVSKKDATFSSKMTKETFIQRMENEPEYNNRMHTWISKKDPRFSTRLPLNEFQKKTLKKKDTLDSGSEVGSLEPTKVYDPLSGELLGEVDNTVSTDEKKQGIDDYFQRQEDVNIEEDANISIAIQNGLISDEDLIKAGYKQPKKISTVSSVSEVDRAKAKEKILGYRSKTEDEITTILEQNKLNTPYAYVDSSSDDSFVDELFSSTELAAMNINPKDFDGFLEEKGYKKDFQDKDSRQLFDRSYMTSVDPKLALETEKARMLNLYIAEQIDRDIKFQKLNEEKETGINPDNTGQKYTFKPSISNINLNLLDSYVQKNMPILTQKLSEVQERNQRLYKEYMDGGMSVGTLVSSMASAGYVGVRDRLNQLQASASDLLGKTGIDYFSNAAEATRLQMDQFALSDFDPSTYGYVQGRRIEVNGRNYLVDERDQIYDLDIKKRVTSFLDANATKEILNKANKEGVKDFSYSSAGVAIQTSNVVGDMLVQIALTKGAGKALSGAGSLTKGLGILTKTKDVLRRIPMSRGISAAMIAQGTMGLSSGYEQTLKLAKDNGLNDEEARELAQSASIQMGVLYTLTAPISPQTKATEAIFGKIKNETVKNALNAYMKVGKKGFIKTFQEAGKKVVNLTGEGVKEVFQENIQQAGEMMVVNKDINDQAGRNIAKDTITGEDFINTTILSFTAGIIMPGAGSALTSVKRKARDVMGLSGVDRMKSLDYLVRNENKLNSLLQSQLKKGVYTQEEVDNLKSEINTYKDGVGKIPKNIKPEVALEVMSDIAKIRDLESERKQLDPAFHQDIDDKISNIREEIKKKTSKVEEEVLEETKEEIKEPFVTETKQLVFKNPDEAAISPEQRDVFGNTHTDKRLPGKAAIKEITDADEQGVATATYVNQDTGIVDAIISSTDENNFVGYVRVYEDGKETNMFSAKMESTGTAFKNMITSAEATLPDNSEVIETSSISIGGLRSFNKSNMDTKVDSDGNVVTRKTAYSNATKESVAEKGQEAYNKYSTTDLAEAEAELAKIEAAYPGITAKINKKKSPPSPPPRPGEKKVPRKPNTYSIDIDLPVMVKSKTQESDITLKEFNALQNEKEILEEAKKEPFVTEKKKEKLEDALDRPITLTELGGSELDAPIEGDLYVEGQQVVVEDADGRITEIGNVDEISGSTLEELGIVPVESEVKTDSEGNIVFNGETLVPEVSGIKRNKKGNISRVVLRNSDGSITRTLKGANAEDAAYQILLKEATSPEQQQRVNEILEQDEQFQNEFRETTDTTESETDTDTEQDTTEQSTEVESEGLSKLRAAFNKKSTTSGKVNKLKEKVNIDNLIPAAKASLSRLFPDIEIEAFYNEDEYHRAIGEEDQSGGAYINNKVYINLTRASETTVAHEVFHAILAKSLGSNTEIQNLTKRFVDALINGNDKKVIQALADKVDTIEQYKDVANEEIMAELFGVLAGFGKKLKPETKSLVRRFLDQVAKILGLKKFTENELIDVLNTLSQKVAKGEVITSDDVSIFKGGKIVDNPVQAIAKKSVGLFDVQYTEDNKRKELIDKGLLSEINDVSDFSGFKTAITSPDDMLAGTISIDGKQIFEGGGGIFFVTKYGDVWASGKKGTANTLAKMINDSFKSNEGKGFLVLAKGADQKLISSVSGVNSSLAILDVMLDKGLISPSDFRSSVSVAVKKAGGIIKLRGSAKQLKSDVNKYFSDPSTTTFEKRGNVVKEIIGRIAQSNSVKENSLKIIDLLGGDTTKRLGKGKTELAQSLGDLVANVAAEQLTKGLSVGDVYGIIEVNSEVEVVEDSHPSYPFHVRIKDGSKPKLILPKNRQNGSEILKTSTGKPYRVGNVSILSGSFNSDIKAKKQVTGNNANDIVKYAKENNISDSDIRAFGKELGIDSDEINKAIDKYNSNIGISVTEIRKRSEENIKKRVKKKSLRERSRLVREMFLDRQTRIKDVLKGINSKQAKAALAKIVTKAGASGYANFRFKEADKKIYKDLSTSDKNTLDEIIYANRIISINKNRRSQGKEEYKGIDGYNDKNAQRDLDDIKNKLGDKKFNDLVSRSKEYFKVFDDSLKRMFEADLISEEVYKQLRDLDYSPIKTLKYILPENSNAEEIDRVAIMSGVTKDAIKSLSDENVNDIVTDTRWLLQTNLSMIEATIFENRMLNAFNDAISQATEDEKKAINEIILDNPIIGSYKDGRPKRKYDDKYDTINYKKVFFKKDGVSRYMVVSKVHAEQLLDVKTKPDVISKAIQVGSGTNVLRFFATAGNPLFIVGNTAVDFQNILFLSDTYSKNKFVGGVELAADFVKNTISKMVSTNNYKKTYEEYMIHGGSIDYLATDGLKSLESLKPTKKIFKVPVNTMKYIGKTLSYLGETSEISFRIAVYEKSKSNQIKAFKKNNNNREPNADEMEEIMFEATREARETIDFSQGGSATKAADKVLPYLNASTQGLRKAIDYANDNPVGFASSMIQAFLMAGGMMAGSLLLLMRGLDDDDDIEEVLNRVSDYEKSNYHVFFTGKKDEDGEYEYYRVRKLPTISVFSTLAEQLVIKAALKSKGIDYDINGEVMEKSLLNALPIVPSATGLLQRNPLLAGLITYNTNYDMFYDQPVFVGPRGKKIAPEAEGLYDPKVNNIYKDLAPAIGLSPKRSKAFMEKIITSETTNPVIGLIYSGYDAFTGKTEPGKEITKALENMSNNVSKKVKRKTNKDLPVYKSRAEDELDETRIETEIYKKEQEVYNLIKKNHKENKTLSKEELKQIVIENFDKIDHKKYLRKYMILNNKKGVDREILDIVYEDTPEVQALLIFNKFGDSFEEEEENKMRSVFKAARRRFSKKAMYIYNKKYKKK